MSTFDDLLRKVRDVADVAEKKTNEFIDVTKVKMAIARAEKELSATYEGLGRLVYDAKQGTEEIDELIDACVAHIDELNGEVTSLQDQLAEMQNAVRCAACNAYNEKDAAFCKFCGEKLL